MDRLRLSSPTHTRRTRTLYSTVATATVLLLLLCFPPEASGQSNPFISTEQNGSGAEAGEAADRSTSERGSQSSGKNVFSDFTTFGVVVPNWLTEFQRTLYSRISSSFDAVDRSGFASPAFLLLLFFAFLYGLLHALGPGHRKTVLFSYFLARGAPVRTGVAAGLGMALLHGASATAVVLVIYYLLQGALLVGLERTEHAMQLLTFGLLALFGVFMLTRTFFHLLSKRHGHSDATAKQPATGRGGGDRNTLVLILLSGTLPCPGAATILIFAISLGLLEMGLAVVFAMSLGMGATLAGIAMLTLGGRRLLLTSGAAAGRWRNFLHHGVELLGYALVTAFGLLMFLALA